MQSSFQHLAIIMDGNRRWAKRQQRPLGYGHRAGVERAIEVVRAASHHDIEWMTLFAFASANWRRSELETSHLFSLAERALDRLGRECEIQGVRVTVIGRLDRVPDSLRRGLQQLEIDTRAGTRKLRIALDYSSREAIFRAAQRVGPHVSVEEFERYVAGDAPPVDLLIRTGSERRLSDFLLWESAFAELYFSDRLWPDFDASAFEDALAWYQQRSRRFGA
jgi:undecaprenyl diphosphate synthase